MKLLDSVLTYKNYLEIILNKSTWDGGKHYENRDCNRRDRWSRT